MQKEVSTNIRIPEEQWRAIKVKAAQEGRSMKDLILEGIERVLGNEGTKIEDKENPLLKFLGRVQSDVTDGSVEHDRYIYNKK